MSEESALQARASPTPHGYGVGSRTEGSGTSTVLDREADPIRFSGAPRSLPLLQQPLRLGPPPRRELSRLKADGPASEHPNPLRSAKNAADPLRFRCAPRFEGR